MKIFWTFDPFEENKSLRRQAVKLIKLLRSPKDSLTAVYAASDEEVSPETAGQAPQGRRFSALAAEKMKEQLSALGLKDARVSVVKEPRFSLTASVRSLAKHVGQGNADLLVCSTHGRSGVKRFFLGSFAETLIHFTETDLLLFGEKTQLPMRAPKALLYAHDFTKKGDAGFERAARYAKVWGTALHIFHSPQASYGIEFEGQDRAVEAYRRKVRAKAAKIEAQLLKANLIGSVTIMSEIKPVADLLQSAIRRTKADIVLLSAQSGRFAALLGGSVTRQMVREAKVPTLVMKH